MPFLFQWLCELLEELQRSSYKRTLTSNRAQNYENQVVYNWYSRFNHKIERTGPAAVAFLSCLLPERRPDRVYNLQVKRLSRIFGRALGLGASRALTLNKWREHDGADFPTCVELTLRECENDKPVNGNEVTLEEIDEVLDLIAAHAISSFPTIRAKVTNVTPTELLAPILHRLQSSEAKWLARMLLKDYAPIEIPEREILRGFHFMLPNLLALQNSFDAAVTTLADPDIRHLPPRPDKNYERALHSLVSQHVQPRLGVMIRRQPYDKARSIKHCCSIASGRVMSVERKYDGEYCQIHIDMSKEHDCIQIFSKSGKNSTMDRIRLHTVIKDALRIGHNGCRIREKCIIEGELLVWNDVQESIQPFHKIRKYVKHGGRDIGTAHDSPKKPEEWLMIAFYDILVLDNRMLLNKPNKIRRQYLKSVLQTKEGRAILCERKIIDFSSSQSAMQLRQFFAQAITQRWEGLVLKGLDDPYFCWNNQNHSIKLKKDYITGLGNVADLCIVGARREPRTEQQIRHGRLKWTSFYVGALCNMEEVRRFDKKPLIKIIDILTHHSMPIEELLDIGQLGQLWSVEYTPEIAEFKIEMCRSDVPPPDVLFKKPFIIEIMGAGFDKPSNASFFTLRFPRKVNGKVKLHTDRTLLDTVSFAHLQHMAEQSFAIPTDEDVCEDAGWIEKLIQADGLKRTGNSTSQDHTPAGTIISASTKSPSTVSFGAKSASQIFIRPDTEEPEYRSTYQDVNCTTILEEERYNSHLQDQLLTKPQQLSSTETCERRGLKLDRNADGSRGSKRLCLKDVKNYEGRKTISQVVEDNPFVSSLSFQETSSTRRRPAQNNRMAVTPISYTEAFDPPADFFSPRTTRCYKHLVSEALGSTNARPTPDSTLVMRQILSVSHRPNDHLAQSTPTKLVTNKSSRSSQHLLSFPRKLSSAHTNSPSLLPTPPVSSPAPIEQHKRLRALDSVNKMSGLLSDNPMNEITGEDDQGTQNIEIFADKEADLPSNDNVVNGDIIQPVNLPVSAPTHTIHPILIVRTPTWPLLVDETLSRVRLSLTYNTTHFLDYVEVNINSGRTDIDHYHVALTNNQFPLEVASVLFATFRPELEHRVRSVDPLMTRSDGLQQYNNRILLFDLAVLNHEIFSDGIVTLGRLRSLDYGNGSGQDARLFLGVLVFFVRGDNEDIRMDVRYELGWTS